MLKKAAEMYRVFVDRKNLSLPLKQSLRLSRLKTN